MIPVPRSPHEQPKRRGRHSDEETPCIVCGRGVRVTSRTAFVHVHKGGSHVVTAEEAKALNATGEGEAADLGGWPVGPDCLRAHPELKPYVQRTIS